MSNQSSAAPTRWLRALAALVLVSTCLAGVAQPAQAVSPDIVISQIYGGGGNSGATLKNDFIELYNRGASPVDVTGWTVQYTSSAGSSWQRTNLTGTIQPGEYYLIQEAAGSGGTVDLPTPNASGSIAMSATSGKVALVMNTTLLTCGAVAGNCFPNAAIRDFVGYGSAATNFEGSGPTPTLSNTTAALRKSGGAQDTDDNSVDFASGVPNPRAGSIDPSGIGAASPGSVLPGDSTLLTVAVTPGANPASTSLAVVSNLSAIGGSPTQTLFDDATNGDVTPGDNTFSYSATVTSGTSAGAKNLPFTITDAQGRSGSGSISLNVTSPVPCSAADITIGSVQGSSDISPNAGQTVTVQGVVVGDYEGASPTLRGFYLQDAGDGDPATSDGIFVFESDNANRVGVGEMVQVTGSVSEFQNQTQISATTGVESCGMTSTVAPTDVTMPFANATALEANEGMLVRFPQTLYVTEHFQLGRFGQVVMSADGRLKQPTNVVAPGAPALALQAANNLNRIIVDDALQNQNPDPILFGRGGNPLSASNTLRGGDTATGMVGVMSYTWAGNAASGNAYRLRPINALGGGVPNFQPANPRPASAPAVGGTLHVAGMNLLNFFNTFSGCTNGVGGAATDCRGANSQTEFDRQWPKTVAAIVGIGADIIGVNEIENDGYGPTSAIQFLVDKLNAATTPGTYAFIDVDAATGQVNALGTDAIKVGLIYKPGKVTPVGQTAALNTVAFVNGGDGAPRSRPTVAQAFEVTATGARFIVDVNHLKSKGSACDAPDAGDGQGNCNTVRVNAATALMAWLATNPTGTGDPDILMVGDYNSYAKEDPITTIRHGPDGLLNTSDDFTNLIESLIGPDAYSYVFDGQWGYLDHALGSASIVSQVTGVGDYHINSDEPSVLDYNTEFKSSGQLMSLYSADRFRMSDHDSVLVGLDLINYPPTADAGGPYSVVEGGSVTLNATGADPEGTAVTFEWDLDNDGTFETPGQGVNFSAASIIAPATLTVKVKVTDEFGNFAVDETTVSVIYNFTGFFQPVDNPPVINSVKAGSGVPVKFSLGGDKGLDIFADGYPKIELTNCESGPTDAIEETVANGASGLQYDPVTNTYTYVLKTQKSWKGKCGQFIVLLNDGTTHTANFQFT
jgi:predicted extracellular nuclease